MPIGRILALLIILAVIGGGAMWWSGNLKFNENGPQVTAPDVLPQGGAPADDFARGNQLLGESKYQDAVIAYRAYISKNPGASNIAEAYYRIPKCYEGMKDAKQALPAYEEYRAKFPNDNIERRQQADKQIELMKTGNWKPGI